MSIDKFANIFPENVLADLFPTNRADNFFEALYGDIEEGVYDISLAYQGYSEQGKILKFMLNLTERPGKCLACHLTYGLPEVFSRHPIIDIKSVVEKIDTLLGDEAACGEWRLEPTQNISRQLYGVPLTIELKS